MTESLPGVSFLLPLEYDLTATFIGAVTGAWAASRRGYDFVGVCVIAFVSSVGGGLLRDAMFLMQIPVAMQHPQYLWTILSAVAVGILTFRYSERFTNLFAYSDALALGVFGIYGANRALIAGLSPEGAIIVGACNAVGGGLIRDILVREEPLIFKPRHLYTLAALAGILVFVVLSHRYGVDTVQAAWIGIFVTMAMRLAAIRFGWKTHAVRNWFRARDDHKT